MGTQQIAERHPSSNVICMSEGSRAAAHTSDRSYQSETAPRPALLAAKMQALLTLVFVVFTLCFQTAALLDLVPDDSRNGSASHPSPEACAIELECVECVPEHAPLVRSHAAGEDGTVRLRAGERLALSCGAGKFLAYPLLGELAAECEAGRYRVLHDRRLRHLLDLGCQEDLFEDVLHPVEHCPPPLQGRAYLTRQDGRVRHAATVCYDADRAIAVRLRAARVDLALPAHADGGAPLSLLGNFNQMFDASTRRDAERLYSGDASLNRRLRELLRHERASLGGLALTAGRLLAPQYLAPGSERAARFASNAVAVWGSVAAGNLRHLQADVARLLRARAGLQVQAGTHGTLRAAAGPLLLRGGRFPVPRYVWTAVADEAGERGAALVLLNDPLVRVSEIRAAVFCESACAALPWLRDLLRHGNYERPALGLVFCCNLRDFAALVPEMPNIFNSTVRMLV